MGPRLRGNDGFFELELQMHHRAGDIVAAARGCVGTRFRGQGRVSGVGLDCLGVVIVAAAAAGVRLPDEADYSLRGEGLLRLDARIAEAMVRVERAEAGDVLLFEPGSAIRHLGVWTGTSLIHAHAGLRRVVEGPVDPAWALIGIYRFR